MLALTLPRTPFAARIEWPLYSANTLSTSAIGRSSKFTVMRLACDWICVTGTSLPLMNIVASAGVAFLGLPTGAGVAECTAGCDRIGVVTVGPMAGGGGALRAALT